MITIKRILCCCVIELENLWFRLIGEILTVQPFRVVFKGALEIVLLTS